MTKSNGFSDPILERYLIILSLNKKYSLYLYIKVGQDIDAIPQLQGIVLTLAQTVVIFSLTLAIFSVYLRSTITLVDELDTLVIKFCSVSWLFWLCNSANPHSMKMTTTIVNKRFREKVKLHPSLIISVLISYNIITLSIILRSIY